MDWIDIVLDEKEDNFLAKILNLVNLNNSDSALNACIFPVRFVDSDYSFLGYILLLDQLGLVFTIPLFDLPTQLIYLLLVLLLHINMILF